MSNCNIRFGYRIAASALSLASLIALTGCFGSVSPSTFDLVLPDGTTVTVSPGSVVESLANSAWALTDAAGTPIVTIRFGAAGNLERFENNTIAGGVLGSTLIFDGRRHDTDIPLVEYEAVAFGAPASDTGFVFHAEISALAPLVGEVAAGFADASGEVDPETDIMTGELSFDIELSSLASNVAGISGENLGREPFEFTATRVE